MFDGPVLLKDEGAVELGVGGELSGSKESEELKGGPLVCVTFDDGP